MRYSLRDSQLKIIIKGSFTESFYPSDFTKMFLAPLWFLFVFFFEKLRIKLYRIFFFFHENALYGKDGAIIKNTCIL